MASNQPAYAPAPVAEPTGQWLLAERDELLASDGPAPFSDGHDGPAAHDAAPQATAPRTPHRLPRQRTGLPSLGGTAVGSTVLGIAAMAAVGAGGVAAAAEAPAAAPPISLPDAPAVPDAFPAHVTPAAPAAQPQVEVGTPSYDPYAVGYASGTGAPGREAGEAPATVEAVPAAATESAADPGEALRNRIIGQVTRQREAAARVEREAVEKAAAEQAAKDTAARKVREQAAAAKAEAEAKARAAAEAAAQAEADRLSQLAASYVKPVASYTLTTAFGESGNMWATHTGQDFAAPTGTPVHAVHSGTVTSAGWAGSYGYRVVLRLDDGTELWYCHLSTMVATAGQVVTGDTIGRVGATGNVPGPHLHLEVRPGGGAPVDPVPWLHGHDVTV